MRKSFTRLFGVILLLTLMSFQVLLAQNYSPTDHFTNVRPGVGGTTVTIQFPADVQPNSGAGLVSLNKYDAGPVEMDPIQVTGTTSTSLVTGSTVVISGSLVTVNFKATVDPQKWYYVTVSPDAFKYVATGAEWAGLSATPTADPATNSGNYDLDFRIGDFRTPIAGLSPAKGSIHAGFSATGVAPNTNLVLTFDEDIQLLGGGSIGLYNGPANPDDAVNLNGNVVDIIQNIPARATAGAVLVAAPYSIVIDGVGTDAVTGVALTHNRITISGLSNLTSLANYYVRATRGTIADMSGNPEGDFTYGTTDDEYDNNTTWTFRAADITPPSVALTIPTEAAYLGSGLTNVSKTPTLVLTFTDDRTANGLPFTLQETTTLYNDPNTPGSVVLNPLENADIKNCVKINGGAVTLGSATISGNTISYPLSGLATYTTYTVTVNDGTATVHPQDGEGNQVNLATSFTFTTGDFTKPLSVAAATVTRNGDADQLVDIFIDDDTQFNDRNQAAPFSEPLTIWVKAVANNATPATLYNAASVKAANIKMTWDAVQDRYELENHDFGLACDTEYDFYFYAEDAANTMSGVNKFSDADVVATKVNLHATDNCFSAPVVTYSSTTGSLVDRNSTIILTFNEQVKSADWNTAISITVPDGTFGAANGADDDITFNAVIDAATNKIVTITELSTDEYELDHAYGLAGADDFAALLSNTQYSVSVDKDLFTDDASGAISNTVAIDGVNDDDPTSNYGSDNKLTSNVEFNFSTEDYQGPVATFSPVDGAGFLDPTTVTAGVNPTITFDEKIFTEAGVAITNANIEGAYNYVELVEVGGTNPNVPATITIDAAGKVVTIVPTVALKSEQRYMIKISSLIEDAKGYPVYRYMNLGTWIETYSLASCESEFETEDTDPPTIVITAVKDGDALNAGADTDQGTVAVDNDSEFRITFNEGVREVASNTLIAAADANMIRSLITLTGPAGEVEFDVIAVINPADVTGAATNDNPTVVYIDPIDYNPNPYLFTAGATYSVAVDGVEDDNSKPANASKDISIYETPESTEIKLLSSVPYDTQAEVVLDNQTLTLNFNVAVSANANNITMTGGFSVAANAGVISNGSKKFVYTLTTPLASDAAYTISIPVASFTALDTPIPPAVAATWPAAVKTIDFTTVDLTAPRIDLSTKITTKSGAALTAVQNTDEIILTFDSPIQKGSGEVWIKTFDNATTVAQLSVGSDGTFISANKLELHLDLAYAALNFDTQYFIELDGDFVKDLATIPNSFEWQRSTGTSTWYTGGFFDIGVEPQGDVRFTTWADTPVPTYDFASFLPVPASNDVSISYNPLVIKMTGAVELSDNLLIGDRQLDIINEGGTTEFTIDMYGGGVDIVDGTITVDPLVQYPKYKLASDANYYLSLDDDVLVKSSGMTNPALPGFTSTFTVAGPPTTGTNWFFTTQDLTRPRIASVDFSPANDGTSVSKAAKVIVTFTEPVALTAANWDDVFDFQDWGAATEGANGMNGVGTAAEVGSAVLNADKTVLTITMSAAFEVDADVRTVTMSVNPATFTDEATIPNANIGDPYVVAGDATFVIVDERKPKFTAFTNNGLLLSPDGDKVKVAVNTDEDVTVYLYAVNKGAAMPNEATMMGAGAQEFTVDASDAPKVLTYIGLDECDDKDIYFMAKDAVGNISDNGAAGGNQPAGPINKQTSDVTAPELATIATSPLDGDTIQVFTQRYGSTDTPVRIYFDEPIALTGVTPNFRVRDYDTNLDVGVTASITNDAANSKYYVELVPNLGIDWAADAHYYVEMDYGIIEDVPCNGAVANEYADAFYGKEEFDFFTGPLYVAPALSSLWPADGQDMVVFDVPDELKIKFTQPVRINYGVGTPVYIYRYDDLGANPQEVISVVNSYVKVLADGVTVSIRIDHLLTPVAREHYRVILPANLIWDATRADVETDASKIFDLTPVNGTPIGAILTAGVGDNHVGNPWWDFWALDQVNPNYAWTSDWVNNYVPDNYAGEKINNFPVSDARVFQEGDLTIDNIDNGIGDPLATRNIYLSFNEEIFTGTLSPYTLVTLPNGTNVSAKFTFKDLTVTTNVVTFTAIYDKVLNRVDIVPTSDYISEHEYEVTVASDYFKDVAGLDLTTLGSTKYNFKAWLDETPTVTVTATPSIYDAGRVATRPEITITFNRGVLLKNNYQVLRNQDIMDLIAVNGGIDYDIISYTDNKVIIIQPKNDLVSESNLAVTIGGNPVLVDDIRAYTLNSNDFTDTKTVNFTVEDDIPPVVNIGGYFPTGTNVDPEDPISGGGNYLKVLFSEKIVKNTSSTGVVDVRRAWVTGPQSQGAGSIFQLTGVADLEVRNNNELWIPITGGEFSKLEVFTGFSVQITAGLILDEAGLPYGGINNNITWTFATDDGTPPTVIETAPELAGRPSNFSVTQDFSIKFDENIKRGTGNIVIYQRDPIHSDTDDGNAVEIINAADPLKVLISGSDPANGKTSDIVTIRHDELAKGFVNYIRYDAGIVVDVNNNNPTPLRYDFSWDFTTSEHLQPLLTTVTPDGLTVNQEPLLSMEFDSTIPIRLGDGNLSIYEYYYDASLFVWNTKLVTTINSLDATQVDPDVTDNIVKINPTIKLADGVNYYYVLVDAAFVTNKTTGDYFAGIADESRWNFMTEADVTAPVLAVVADSVTTNVTCSVMPDAVTATLTMYDLNGIMAGTGVFSVFESADGVTYSAIGDINAVDATFVSVADAVTGYYPAEQTVTLDLSVLPLQQQHEYYITVGANAIVDQSRSALSSFDETQIAANDWAFSLNDFTAPDVLSAIPAGIDVEADTVITIEFNEPIQVGANPELTITDGTTPIVVAITDANIVDGNKVVVALSSLAEVTTYTVSYADSFVYDLAYGVCTDLRGALANSWEFTTDDNIAPIITGTSPKKDLNFNITIAVDEDVVPVAGMITLTAEGQTPIAIAVDMYTMAAADTFIYPVAIASLVDGIEYTVTVDAGAYQDLAQIPNVTSEISWPFNTGDNTAPTLVNATPQGTLSTYLDLNLVAKFSEPVSAGSGSVTISGGAAPIAASLVKLSDSVMQVVPAEYLDFDIAYSVEFGDSAVIDVVGISYVQIPADVWTVTVIDGNFENSCLDKTAFLPADGTGMAGTTPVKSAITLSIDFCEKVVSGAINGDSILLYEVDGSNLSNLYTKYAITRFENGDSTAVIEVSGLKDFTTYGVLADMGAVLDENGNEWLGITDPTWWNFRTGDNTAPTILTAVPDALPAATQEFEVLLTFSEAVVNVNAENVIVDNGAIESITGSGMDWLVTIAGEDGDVINLTVGTGIIDAPLRNNLDQEYVYTYKIGDNTAPTLTWEAVAADPQDTIFNVKLIFSEPVTGVDGVDGAVTIINGIGDVTAVSTTEYLVTVKAAEETSVTIEVSNAVIDSVNNAFAGADSTFYVGDFTAPTVMANPASGDDMPSDFWVELTFSDDAIVTADDITVDGAESYFVSTDADSVHIIGLDDAEVMISVSSEIVDEAGNSIVAPLDFSYTIGDNTAPMIVSVDAPWAKDTINAFDITLTFDEPVNIPEGAITVNNGTIVIVPLSDHLVYKANIEAEDGDSVVMTLSDMITDMSSRNNKFVATDYIYTIGDNTAPTVVVAPDGGSDLNNTFEVSLAFSEIVSGVVIGEGVQVIGATDATITGADDAYSISITAADKATVTVVLNNKIMDAANNKFEGASYNYSVGDNVDPTVVNVSPASGTDMDNDFAVTIVFSEVVTGVDAGVTVTNGTKTVTGSGMVYTVAINAVDGADVTLALANSITDVSGRAIAAASYSYTVGDHAAPTVAVDPASGTDMANDFDVTLTFNEEVTGVMGGVSVTGGTGVVTGSGSVYTVAISADDESTVTMALASTIKDNSGNALVAASFTYTIGLNTPVYTIAEIQGTGDATTIAADQVFMTKGFVTGVNEDLKGFFIQDANGVRNGVYVYDATAAAAVSVGSSIELTGKVKEYNGITEIFEVTNYKLVSKVADITAETIAAADMASEDYEGVLVTVKQLKTTGMPSADSYGEWYTIKPNANIEVTIDEQLFTYEPDLGQFYDITGVVNYSYDEYKLAPRSVGDLSKVTSNFKLKGLAMDIYPNPFDNYITIKNSSDVQITKAVITNIAGQIVMEVSNPDNAIATSELHVGVYFISLHTVDGIAKTERIIKK